MSHLGHESRVSLQIRSGGTVKSAVLLVGAVGGVLSTILQLPAVWAWQYARFTLGILLIAACLAGGFVGASSSRRRDGALGGIEAAIIMLAIARAARWLRGGGDGGTGFVELIPYLLFMIAFGAAVGAIGAKLRRRPAGQLPG